MSKFQPVRFSSVDDMLSSLPPDERGLTQTLRNLVLSCLPHCQERLSYNVPYYFGNKRICFIWPGSVPWGTVREGVQLGFVNGPQLTDVNHYLERGERKQVFWKTFFHAREVERDSDQLRELLFEAAAIDHAKTPAKRKK